MSKLEGVHLKENESEKWVWNLESFGIYSVKPAYKCIMSDGKNRTEEVFLKIWHKFIPLKVAVFSWQVLQDRITLKVNLLKRGILLSEDKNCSGGCGLAETTKHLLF